MTTFFMAVALSLGAHSAAAGKEARTSAGLRLHGAARDTDRADQDVQQHSLIVQSPQIQHQLIVCNAYAAPNALNIIMVRTRRSLTEQQPLGYKQCRDFSLPLEEGDQLDFKAGELFVGSFYATGLPKSSASLLLIPHRRTAHSVGLSFESHAFSETQSPQIAVIDAYRGADMKADGVKIIQNLPASGEKAAPSRVEEDLRFNSVVAVNPGSYQIALAGTGSETIPLNAASASKHVIMRLGVDGAAKGNRYPQELIVFPNGAARAACFGAAWALVASVFFAHSGMF